MIQPRIAVAFALLFCSFATRAHAGGLPAVEEWASTMGGKGVELLAGQALKVYAERKTADADWRVVRTTPTFGQPSHVRSVRRRGGAYAELTWDWKTAAVKPTGGTHVVSIQFFRGGRAVSNVRRNVTVHYYPNELRFEDTSTGRSTTLDGVRARQFPVTAELRIMGWRMDQEGNYAANTKHYPNAGKGQIEGAFRVAPAALASLVRTPAKLKRFLFDAMVRADRATRPNEKPQTHLNDMIKRDRGSHAIGVDDFDRHFSMQPLRRGDLFDRIARIYTSSTGTRIAPTVAPFAELIGRKLLAQPFTRLFYVQYPPRLVRYWFQVVVAIDERSGIVRVLGTVDNDWI